MKNAMMKLRLIYLFTFFIIYHGSVNHDVTAIYTSTEICLDELSHLLDLSIGICTSDETGVIGGAELEMGPNSNVAAIDLQTPYQIKVRFYGIRDGVVPQQFAPENLANPQSTQAILDEISRQYDIFEVEHVSSASTLTIENAIVNGYTFWKPDQEELVHYWALKIENRFLIIEIEESSNDTNWPDKIPANYQSLHIHVETNNLVYLPLVTNGDVNLNSFDNASDVASVEELPTPSWWDGLCNTNNYIRDMGINSYSLGSFRGVHACGPRPHFDNVSNRIVRFFPNAWGQLEWQCVELVMRYMYLAYGTHPYGGSGNKVYNNYAGSTGIELEKIPDGTVGKYPEPGDVVSFDWGTYGHASIVIESSVDQNGNGYYKTLNQNASSSILTHHVRNWETGSIGWLADTRESENPTLPSYTLGDLPAQADYDGDGITEISVWRPSNGIWYISTENLAWTDRGENFLEVKWGSEGDIPVPADYDGDGIVELATWRPSNGTWYISTENLAWTDRGENFLEVKWGSEGDVPIPADYDGDGIVELATWRPSNGTWYISTENLAWTDRGENFLEVKWGSVGDIPIPADYDGDGIVELATWRPSNGTWYISTENLPWVDKGNSYLEVQWGSEGDSPQPYDYNMDGSDEIAVWRPSSRIWYISTNNLSWVDRADDYLKIQWGSIGDIPTTGDYDNDGQTELAVWRPANGTWYVSLNNTSWLDKGNAFLEVQWGTGPQPN